MLYILTFVPLTFYCVVVVEDESLSPLSEVNIVLLGLDLSGKSSTSKHYIHDKTFETEAQKRAHSILVM